MESWSLRGSPRRLPVSVLTGFRGSGKTTIGAAAARLRDLTPYARRRTAISVGPAQACASAYLDARRQCACVVHATGRDRGPRRQSAVRRRTRLGDRDVGLSPSTRRPIGIKCSGASRVTGDWVVSRPATVESADVRDGRSRVLRRETRDLALARSGERLAPRHGPLRASPPARAATCLRSGARSCRRGPTAYRGRGGFQTGQGPLLDSCGVRRLPDDASLVADRLGIPGLVVHVPSSWL